MIHEDKLRQYDSDDVVTDEFIHQMDDETEYLFLQYKHESNIDQDVDFDEYTEDEDNLKDFDSWLKYEFEYKFDEQKDLYETLFRNGSGRMTLFRAMYVPNKWIKSLQHGNVKLGIYWAYEETAAEAHWGYGQGTEILLQTSVTEDQVDFVSTFSANLHPSIGEEEKEITLNKDEKIPLEALWVKDKEINLNKTIKSHIYLT